MRPLLLAIFSLGVFQIATAQEDSLRTVSNADSVKLTSPAAQSQEQEQTPVRKVFGMRLYWDYGKTLVSLLPDGTRTELGGEVLLFDRYQLVGEAGTSALQPHKAYQNVDYSVSGKYFRLGAGYLGYVNPTSRIGLGLRYGEATYEDAGTVTITSGSDFNDPYQRDFERSGLDASWYEIVFNSEKKLELNKKNPESGLNRIFSLGIMFRYRVLISYSNQTPVDVYLIPGYGRTFNERVPAVNLFLKLHLF